jgi:cell division protein FtsB
MILRIIVALLLVVVLALQYRIWASPGGMREVWRLEKAIAVQQQENERLAERNRTLAAEVRDLKEGRAAIEERARTDLGMVKSNETFFQVVPPARTPAPAAPPAAAPAEPADAAPGSPPQRTAQAETP